METTRNTRAANVELARFMRKHHGAIGTADLRRLGFDKYAVQRMVKSERLLQVHRGGYRAGDAAPSAHTLVHCALLTVGNDAALARATAAHTLGLIEFAPRQIQLVMPRKGPGRTRAGLDIHQTADLPSRDLIKVEGMRCSNARRAILDLAAETKTSAEFKLLRRAVRQGAVRNKRLTKWLAEDIDQREPFRGSRLLATVLDEHREGTTLTRSDLEDRFLELCRSAGIPLPETNVMVEGFEVDGLWRFARVIVELDTYGFHGDEWSFENNRDRDGALLVAGYGTIRITQLRLEREPAKIVRQLRTLLGL